MMSGGTMFSALFLVLLSLTGIYFFVVVVKIFGGEITFSFRFSGAGIKSSVRLVLKGFLI